VHGRKVYPRGVVGQDGRNYEGEDFFKKGQTILTGYGVDPQC